MAKDTLFVNKPGGVIAHLEGGSSTGLRYGQRIENGNEVVTEGGVKAKLADYVDPSTFSDNRDRGVDNEAAARLDAHRRAALDEGGQVNSSSSAVPGNYDELDEDAAARLVANLERYPGAQASVIKHEILFGGNRQKVVDSASDVAIVRANAEIEAAGSKREQTAGIGKVTDEPVAGSPGDPDVRTPETIQRIEAGSLQTPEPTSPAPADRVQQAGGADPQEGGTDRTAGLPDAAGVVRNTPESVDAGEAPDNFDDFTKKQLVAYAGQHGVEVSKSAPNKKIVDQLKDAGHDKPQTPPQE